METEVFNGNKFAQQQLVKIKAEVSLLAKKGIIPRIATLVFVDDPASRLYTQFKRQAAEQVGVKFQAHEFRLSDDFDKIKTAIDQANLDKSVTGVMIQKPAQAVWQADYQIHDQSSQNFGGWWQSLVSLINPHKDIDGLHPTTLEAIKNNLWQKQGRVLPATAQAVLDILDESPFRSGMKTVIVGRSDIVGLPIYYELQNRGEQPELLGRLDFIKRQQSASKLLDADVVITATGVPGLIKGEMLKMGVILIDAGEPKPDVDRSSIKEKTIFLTPVPGGVGPVTVACLMKNVLTMVQ